MKKLFGTDGMRGIAGQFPLDYPTVLALGKSLVHLLREEGLEPRILIGRDTRESGAWIEQALFQGIQEEEGEVVSAGVIPTSAVSYLTIKHAFRAGIVISASHNPYQDNGIKIFSSRGFKISDAWEARLEKDLAKTRGESKEKKTDISPLFSLRRDYEDFLAGQLASLPPKRNLTLVVDCSNGASSVIAPEVLSSLGFKVEAIHNSPDGKNINRDCGSLHPESLARAVLKKRADLGIAYDGDADRAIWVDERGRILNGDHTLFVLARFMKKKGRLKSRTVVATTMSNVGLEKALQAMGLELARTKVGDKYVLEEMLKLKANLGGEQSGHTIFLDDCPTGDGILTSLKLLEAMMASGMSLSKLVEDYEEFPQILLNVKVKEKVEFSRFPEIIKVMEEIKRELDNSGRLDVRYSGTESLARVMVEGEDKSRVETLARKMIEVLAKDLA